MQIVSLVIAIARAIPIIDRWLEMLVLAYTKQRQEELIKLNKKIIDEAIQKKDQRKIESESYSGRPSGHGSTVDSLPRMRNQTTDKR